MIFESSKDDEKALEADIFLDRGDLKRKKIKKNAKSRKNEIKEAARKRIESNEWCNCKGEAESWKERGGA